MEFFCKASWMRKPTHCSQNWLRVSPLSRKCQSNSNVCYLYIFFERPFSKNFTTLERTPIFQRSFYYQYHYWLLYFHYFLIRYFKDIAGALSLFRVAHENGTDNVNFLSLSRFPIIVINPKENLRWAHVDIIKIVAKIVAHMGMNWF